LLSFFFIRRPFSPSSTLFPYTTLFRSRRCFPGFPGRGPLLRPWLPASEMTPRPPEILVRPSSFIPHPCPGTPQNSGCAGPSSLRSEEHTSELQSHLNLVCRLLLEKKQY